MCREEFLDQSLTSVALDVTVVGDVEMLRILIKAPLHGGKVTADDAVFSHLNVPSPRRGKNVTACLMRRSIAAAGRPTSHSDGYLRCTRQARNPTTGSRR